MTHSYCTIFFKQKLTIDILDANHAAVYGCYWRPISHACRPFLKLDESPIEELTRHCQSDVIQNRCSGSFGIPVLHIYGCRSSISVADNSSGTGNPFCLLRQM